MIFVDSNITMYLVGSAHPNKDAARRLLEASISRGERLVTDAEVFLEILHRYAATARLASHAVAASVWDSVWCLTPTKSLRHKTLSRHTLTI